jgi:hypothetical protein
MARILGNSGLRRGSGASWGGVLTTAQETNNLVQYLVAIFGSTLIGLWIGEDLVVDGSNNVTSWPGRIGATLTNSTANRFTIGTINGRTALAPGTIAQFKSLEIDSGLLSKSDWVVTVGCSATSANETAADAYNNASASVIRDASTSSFLTATGWAHRVDGVATETIPTSGIHVFEGYRAANTATGSSVGGHRSISRVWPEEIALRMALSAVPTTLQRLQAQLALDSYYRPAQAPAARLALDLYNILGASLIGLWVGEDLVVDGSNNVTSWPGRFGTTMANLGAGYFTKTTLLGRPAITAAAAVGAELTATGLSTNVVSCFCAAEMIPVPATQKAQLFSNRANERNLIYVANGTSTFYLPASVAHYVDGVASEAVPIGVHLIEATSGVGLFATASCGYLDGTANWVRPQSVCGSLSANMTTSQRAAVTAVIRSYSGF